MELIPAAHSRHTFAQVEDSGPAMHPLDFPRPILTRGMTTTTCVVDPDTGSQEVKRVIHRGDVMLWSSREDRASSTAVAYMPLKKLKGAMYGSIWVCLVLKLHRGKAADQAAREKGVEPGAPNAPIIWELTPKKVALKKVEMSRVPVVRCNEDPKKEVAAMQSLRNVNILASLEVLQDRKYLYSIIPYCSDGDLFGYVKTCTMKEGKRKGGLPELEARYWFRQMLKVNLLF